MHSLPNKVTNLNLIITITTKIKEVIIKRIIIMDKKNTFTITKMVIKIIKITTTITTTTITTIKITTINLNNLTNNSSNNNNKTNNEFLLFDKKVFLKNFL